MTTDQRTEAWIKHFQANPLGPYELHDYCGGGNFGLVFEALDTRNRQSVAVKVLSPTASSDGVQEFADEGRLLKKLSRSSGVVDLINSGTESMVLPHVNLEIPIQFHVMELAAGALSELLQDESRRNSLSWIERIGLWRGAIKGIHQMHLARCVHRDLKSSNLLLFVHPFNRTVCKVADLGRARDLSEPARLSVQQYAIGRGDLRFAAPESIYLQNSGDAVAFRLEDLYGLGSILYELATGQGITSVALGFGPKLLEMSMKDFAAGQRRDLSGLRSEFNRALTVFEAEMPKVIRERATSLVRQLCNPVPEQRRPTFLGRPRAVDSDLTWLMRQADIMIKTLSVPSEKRGRYRKAGGSEK
ncbi:serine/threonine protein kinase [Asanoa hainanensis]|uniref:serine/threonine protein kinase n=1 Tax=Asanoa hainanensis TaxID=560556 RepID=UPI0015C5EB56|nr:protein kinase [Asanoa hainanensis]